MRPSLPQSQARRRPAVASLCVAAVVLVSVRASVAKFLQATACRKSSIKSPASSNPIETRTVPASTPAARASFLPRLPKKNAGFPRRRSGFAFYLLVFSPTASLEFPLRLPFRAIIKL